MHVERAKRADDVSGQIKGADQNYSEDPANSEAVKVRKTQKSGVT
jgi:hypothetical protein